VATQGKKPGAKAPKKSLPGEGPDLKKFYLILALVAVAGIGWIGYSVMNRGTSAAMAPIQLTGVENPQELLRQAQGVVAGNVEGTAAQVLVFSDFTCPACQRYVAFVEPQVKSEFVQNSMIRYIYYDYPLGGDGQHRYGFLAARAARCAGEQGKFWEYHDLLFGRQAEWSYTPQPPVDDFVEFSSRLGMNAGTFRGCLESDKYADVVTANRLLGDQLGVSGTPTVFIGSRSMPDWSNYEAVREAILREIGPMVQTQDTAAAGGM
jgi:protein-disulfide isomerase